MKHIETNIRDKLTEYLCIHAQQPPMRKLGSGAIAYQKVVDAYASKVAKAKSVIKRQSYQETLALLQKLAQEAPFSRKKLYSFCLDSVTLRRNQQVGATVVLMSYDAKDDRGEEEIVFSERGLDKFIKQMLSKQSFSELVVEYMIKKEMTPKEVYTNANLSRQDFSRITSPGKGVKRPTVFSVAIGLRLNWEDTERLLNSAGYAFRSSSLFDLIIKFCIMNKQYEVETINELLYERGQNTLANNVYIKVNDKNIK